MNWKALFEVSRGASAVIFLAYGALCLGSDHMVEEFERYGLSRFRTLTGGLEVAGALGLIVGYFLPAVLLAASAGLSLLMLLGLATRIRVGDPLPSMLPAFVLLVLNAFVFGYALEQRLGK